MDRIVFNGDSVTDCDRLLYPPFGFGYVSKIAAAFSGKYEVINVGTSGDRLVDLDRKWEMDVIGNAPQVFSIAIGINDTWRRYDSNDPTTLEDFERRYRRLLKEVKNRCNSRIVLCEPFLLPAHSEMNLWREDLDPKIEVVHRLGLEFDAVLVPFDQMFKRATETYAIEELASDGIHPSDLGHSMMANLWLEKFLDQLVI